MERLFCTTLRWALGLSTRWLQQLLVVVTIVPGSADEQRAQELKILWKSSSLMRNRFSDDAWAW
jgi:hypothetical protein